MNEDKIRDGNYFYPTRDKEEIKLKKEMLKNFLRNIEILNLKFSEDSFILPTLIIKIKDNNLRFFKKKTLLIEYIDIKSDIEEDIKSEIKKYVDNKYGILIENRILHEKVKKYVDEQNLKLKENGYE